MLYHLGPGGTFDENVYYRRILNEYPDPTHTESRDDGSTISSNSNRTYFSSLALSSGKHLKPNAPLRCNKNMMQLKILQHQYLSKYLPKSVSSPLPRRRHLTTQIKNL